MRVALEICQNQKDFRRANSIKIPKPQLLGARMELDTPVKSILRPDLRAA
jgi:hypothetical protein